MAILLWLSGKGAWAFPAGPIRLPQASTIAPQVDALNDFIFWLGLFLLVATTAVMIFFVIKYHRSRKGRMTAYIPHNTALEWIWTLIPLALMLFIFAWGYRTYVRMLDPTENPLEINILGKQWYWQIQYVNGVQTMNDLVVPAGKPVKLIMTSDDVIHSFFIPDFRVKQDVVPGMYTALTFTAPEPGIHKVFCTEFCGTGHSEMLARVFVLGPSDYQTWMKTGSIPQNILDQAPDISKGASGSGASVVSSTKPSSTQESQTPAQRGERLAQTKNCTTCHSVDGSTRVGPTWKAIFGHAQDLEGGTQVTVDENYLRDSITHPQAQLVKGYPASMPSYQGLLKEEEIADLIAYIKSLK